MNYPLETRTLNFSKEIIRLCKSIKFDIVTSKIVDQLVRSGTSVGANYMEANNTASKKDFRNKICICKKESQETKYRLSLLEECAPDNQEIDRLIQECHEFILIFQKIIFTMKTKENLKN